MIKEIISLSIIFILSACLYFCIYENKNIADIARIESHLRLKCDQKIESFDNEYVRGCLNSCMGAK